MSDTMYWLSTPKFHLLFTDAKGEQKSIKHFENFDEVLSIHAVLKLAGMTDLKIMASFFQDATSANKWVQVAPFAYEQSDEPASDWGEEDED